MEHLTRGIPGLLAALMFADESGGGSDDFADTFADQPDAFIFEDEGDKVVGKVVDFSTGYDPTYREGPYPILIIDDEISGERISVHCFHATMISGLSKANPETGERIGIQFMGEREGAKNNYKDFRVRVDRKSSDRALDFRSVAAETLRESAAREESGDNGEAAEDDLPF